MFRTRYFRFLFIAAAAVAVAVACTEDPVDPADSADTEPVEDAEPASLTINFSIADLGIDVSTRAGAGTGTGTGTGTGSGTGTETETETEKPTGLCGPFVSADMIDPDNLAKKEDYDDKPENKYKWTEAALVNGSRMSCLTVFLIHRRSNKIVGVRRIPDPDCPDHDVRYITDDQSPEGVLNYPPKDDASIATAKKNCILDENGDLAPVLRDLGGKPVLDDQKHIEGLFGSQARITFDYKDPVHVVERKDVTENGKEDGKVREGYDKYIGKSAERLLRGEYVILAIANYDHRVTTASVEGKAEENYPTLNVNSELEKVVNEFHKPEHIAEGLGPFAPEAGNPVNYAYLYNLRFLMNRTLSKTTSQAEGQENDTYYVDYLPVNGKDGKPIKPYIRPAVHQTLTAAKEIYLEAGENVVDIELLRIASRTRVEVKNYAKVPLQVNSLEFSRNYTQSTCYLFRRNKVDRDYSELANESKYQDHDGKGAPMVDYTGIYNLINGDPTYGAIVPFIKDWDSDKDKVMDGVKVEDVTTGKNKKCIFDALMYESHLGYKSKADEPDSFYYTIDVSYPTEKNYETTDLNKLDKNPTEIGYEYLILNSTKRCLTNFEETSLYDQLSAYKDDYFLIQGFQSGKYVYEAANGQMCAASLPDGMPRFDLRAETINVDGTEIDVERFLWRIEVGDGVCKSIKNLATDNYAGVIPDKKEGLMTGASAHQYQLGVSNGYVTFSNKNDAGTEDCFLTVWGNGNNIGGWRPVDDGCRYRLYPANKLYRGIPRMTKKVELTAFSDATGYVEKVREIQRNDFIRILVEVSYNSQRGDFEFQVKDWNEGGGNVVFH